MPDADADAAVRVGRDLRRHASATGRATAATASGPAAPRPTWPPARPARAPTSPARATCARPAPRSASCARPRGRPRSRSTPAPATAGIWDWKTAERRRRRRLPDRPHADRPGPHHHLRPRRHDQRRAADRALHQPGDHRRPRRRAQRLRRRRADRRRQPARPRHQRLRAGRAALRRRPGRRPAHQRRARPHGDVHQGAERARTARAGSRWRSWATRSARRSTIGGTVPTVLALTFARRERNLGTFPPGVTRDYTSSAERDRHHDRADRRAERARPGHERARPPGQRRLRDAAAAAGQRRRRRLRAADERAAALLTYTGPGTNEPLAIGFKQPVAATDGLHSGAYGKTLTFTLSTTTP